MICRIRLATTEALLAKGYLLFSWQLPAPSLSIYNDHSTKVSTSDGGQALRGFRSFSLTFDRMTFEQRRTLRKLVEDSLDSADGLMYATIDRSWNGTGSGEDWIDVSGYPHIPDITPVANTYGKLSNGVTLFVNNLTDINDPASF